MTYSLDFREKVLNVKEKESLCFSAVAQRFDVGLASVVKWSKNIIPKAGPVEEPSRVFVGVRLFSRSSVLNAFQEHLPLHPYLY